MTQVSHASKASQFRFSLTLTATLLCGLAASTSAQNSGVTRVAAERGFTIAPNIQTPIVLKTQPDAACDLHAEGDSDAAHTLRLYANGDGYVKVHVKAKQESEEGGRVQLDCAAAGKVTRYSLHLRTAASPTEDMPAPLTVMPTPKGSKILPALTNEDVHQLSDQELLSRGYPPRPDASTSPDNYANWLDSVSRPITLLPSHLVNRSDISHQPRASQVLDTSTQWSGYVAERHKRTFMAVQGEWYVPPIVLGPANNVTYSAFWVGLDGYYLKELVQAGTEQDFIAVGQYAWATYAAWTELLPQQTTEQDTSLSPNPGDDILVDAWMCDYPSGLIDQNGACGCFSLYDKTQGQSARLATPLNGTYFNGDDAEWIMERPCLNVENGKCTQFAELSDYGAAIMWNAYALPLKGPWVPYSTTSNLELYLWNEGLVGSDNNLLSVAMEASPTAISFLWANFN